MVETRNQHPLTRLDDEDLNMVTAFVMASGSIKDLAGEYGVSYPTMRQRLDRLIERLGRLSRNEGLDQLGDLLADLIVKGQVSAGVAARIRDLHRRELDSARGEQTNQRHRDDGDDHHA